MASDNGEPDNTRIEERLQQLGHYSRFVRAGLGVILAAFIIAVVVLLPQNTDSLASAVEALLMPLIFVGMGLLLFGIGMHLHLLHQNIVRQLRNEPNTDEMSADKGEDS